MVVRPLADGRTLVDREVLVALTRLTEETIRKRLRPERYDRRTRRALYDYDGALSILAGVAPWAARRRRRAA